MIRKAMRARKKLILCILDVSTSLCSKKGFSRQVVSIQQDSLSRSNTWRQDILHNSDISRYDYLTTAAAESSPQLHWYQKKSPVYREAGNEYQSARDGRIEQRPFKKSPSIEFYDE